MFIKLVGLSLILHLSIIIGAWIINQFRTEKLSSVFQTHGKRGGVVHSVVGNRLISISILLFVFAYTVFMLYIAIITGIETGSGEPQVVFMTSLLGTVFTFVIAFLTSQSGVVVLATILFVWLGVWAASRVQVQRGVMDAEAAKLGIPTPGRWVMQAISVSAVVAFVTRIGIGAAIGAALFSVPLWASAQIVEPGFESAVVASDFSLPTATAFTPDGRVFVAEKNGVVKVIQDGVVLSTPLITLTDVNTFGDRGLIGLAIDPNFAQTGYVYLSYTYENSPGLNVAGPKTARIVRVTVVGNTASEASKVVLVGTVGGNATTPSCEDYAVTDDCIASDSNSHSAGALAFGSDGKLYAATGDGADFAAVDSRALRAQNVDSLAGKVLRINTDGTGPADNPFYNGDPNSNRSKVYALGFRNQFRLQFNQATGRLYGGDVGWSNWEEVNHILKGNNYGWPCREGAGVQAEYDCAPSSATTDPIYTYPHDSNGAGSIVLGAFAANNAYPDQYDNTLFIGDYAQQWIKQLNLDTTGNVVSVTDFQAGGIFPVELNRGLDGNVYYIDIAFGTLNRLTHTDGNRSPVAVAAADPTAGLDPLTVQFSSAGSYDPDGDSIGFAWNFGDGTFAATPNPSHVYTENGTYNATLVVSDVTGASDAETITITVGDQAPTAVITSPNNGSFYRPGDSVMVMGNGFDNEDGTLPASAFEWEVILHHNVHTHPVQQFSGTKTITFVADNHDDADVYMEVRLSVTDSAGLTDTSSITMYYNNAVTGTTNILPNPSLEEADLNRAAPTDWYNGWFGQMNTTFTYPAPGIEGESAVQVDVTDYVSGTAKWFNTPVFVQPGEVYEFSNAYKASTESLLILQYGRPDGSFFYEYLDELPVAPDPTTTLYNITIPAEAETISIFHELAANGTLITDNYSLVRLIEDDTTPPTASITNITANQVLSGVTTIAIDAQDTEGPVTKVHLYVDGAKFGELEDTTAPFTLDWDTTLVADGPHSIQAHVHDEVDNHGLSAPIQVIVDNSSTSTPRSNLINNGNFEIAGPAGWRPNGWGGSTFSHALVAGRNGGVGAQTSITNYPFGEVGDAKWVHDDVPVTPGTVYTFETYYQADTISDVIGRYTYADGSVSYFGIIKEIQPTDTWTYITNEFVPPLDAVSVTFFHLISSEGSLVIDDVAIYDENETTTPSENNAPEVTWITPSEGVTLSGTVTFQTDASDDTDVVGVYYAINGSPFGAEQFTFPYSLAWDTTTYPDGTYVLKSTAHDPYGNNAATTITVTVDNSGTPAPTGDNRIANGDFEIAGPANWARGGWGTNDRVHSHVNVTGAPGQVGRVDITSYTSGDAKWYFTDVAVTPGEVVPFTNSYRSNVGTDLTARFDDGTGVYTYQYLTYVPPSTTWAENSLDITVPAGAESMTIFHALGAVGYLEVDDYTLGGTETTTPEDMTPPVVTLVSPIEGDTVSGVITVTVDATDETNVNYVHLIVEEELIANDNVAPYSFSLDTSAYADGPLEIRASAFDGSNSGVSQTITVTVDNVVITPPNGDNLISNGDFEQLAGANNPADWSEGGYGVNDNNYQIIESGSNNVAYVEIFNYTSGDAKWQFDAVPVTPGETYRYSVDYASLNNNEVVAFYTRADGTTFAELLGYGDAYPTGDETDLANYEVDFTVPADTVTVTVFYTPIVIDVNVLSYNYIDNVSLTQVTGSTTPTGPTDEELRQMVNDLVNQIESLLAAADKQVGSCDLLEIDENATTDELQQQISELIGIVADLQNGIYVVGNCEVTDIVEPSTGKNLILNPDFEIAGPAYWGRGGWGTNDRVHSYIDVGAQGQVGRVEIGSYTSGDAKWYFDDVAVTPGEVIPFTNSYRSNVPTAVTARFDDGTGVYTYVYLGGVPASTAWTTTNFDITVPAGAESMTVFHGLGAVGYLEVDNYFLVGDEPVNPPTDTEDPVVSQSSVTNNQVVSGTMFVDVTATDNVEVGQVGLWIQGERVDLDATSPYVLSWDTTTVPDGQYSVFVRATDTSSNSASTPIVSVTVLNNTGTTTTNFVGNGDLEAGSDTPDGWFQGGWGANTTVFTYPIAGQTGSAAGLEITSYTDGDAKWYFADVPVTVGATYEVSTDYRSNVGTQIVVRYTRADGSVLYDLLSTPTASGGTWATHTTALTVPANVVSLTVFHNLTSVGYLETDTMSVTEL